MKIALLHSTLFLFHFQKIDEILEEVRNKTHNSPSKYSNINRYYSELRGKTYRRVVAWKYGKKGRGNRIPLPSCVVWKIRKYYPDNKNSYTGFCPHSKEL